MLNFNFILGGYYINFKKIEIKIGYKFENTKTLKKALTHTSYYNQKESNELKCFQRLEFLGDSVLDLITSEYLFNKFPFFSEGELSKAKSIIVSQAFLVKLANQISLEKHIIIGKSVDLCGGRGKFSILADCMEAFLGAIYLDGGLKPCNNLIIRLLDNEQIDVLLTKANIKDYKTLLQEITQKKGNCLPFYEIINEEGLDHKKKFHINVIIGDKICGTGTGNSKKEAEKNAAYHALKKLRYF